MLKFLEIVKALFEVVLKNKKEQDRDKLDDLKKLKDFLDNGIITQEEFDTKKKEILGL